MGLPTDLFCRYIPKSWKKIIANANATINSPTKLVHRYHFISIFQIVGKELLQISLQLLTYRQNYIQFSCR